MRGLDSIRTAAQAARQLAPALWRPLDSRAARQALGERLAHREARFLAHLDAAVYRHPASPYRALLRHVGCEPGDLARLVGQVGVEGTLRALLAEGVYLTVDEFKGRRRVRRGALDVAVTPEGLRRPGAPPLLHGQTSGSRGPRTPVPVDGEALRAWAVNLRLHLEARDGLGWTRAYWAEPGGASVAWVLCYALAGIPLARWFSPVDPAGPALPSSYRWSARLVPWVAGLGGARLPAVEHAPSARPEAVLRWLAGVRAAGGTPYLVAYGSALLRLGAAADAGGVALAGARVLAVGEPLTRARRQALEARGLHVLANYASMEAGSFGYSCPTPVEADDLHLFHDLLAVIQPAGTVGVDLPPGALLASTVGPTAAVTLLNVSSGDQGVLVARRCGCALERLGWATHLHTIRSYEKLTAGGMSFLDADLVRVLDETLPARFGGGPGDFQLVEQDGADGRPALRLVVHPRLGPLDGAALVECFLRGVSARSDGDRVMGLVWREAGLLAVERRAPAAAPSGKILHLHAG